MNAKQKRLRQRRLVHCLKEDKARLDWMETHALVGCTEGVCDITLRHDSSKYPQNLREAVDAAMEYVCP